MVADWLGGVAEAAGYYLGGLVTPSDASLKNVLDVKPELLAGHPQPSGEVAAAMATGCRERFGTDYALAVGRFPKFDPSAPQPKPVFFALAAPDGVTVKKFPYAGHPATLKIFCAKRALNLVRLELMEER